ncbi:BCAM0308 family protein [Pseudomonadota bacterium]
MDPKKDIAFHDPNWKKEAKKGKILICKHCNAVYDNKGWKHLEDLDPSHVDDLKKSVCPACHASKNHTSDGVVHLSGDFFIAHKEEILNTINNLADQAEERDVLNRIERIEHTDEGEMIIYTTKNKLAMEIGKHVADAFKGGDLDIQFSKDDMPVEVRWHKGS